MQDAERLEKLEERLEENEQVLNKLWRGLRYLIRGWVASTAGDEKAQKDIQVSLMVEGFTQFDVELTRRLGGNDLQIKAQEELNARFIRDQLLFKFQQRVSGVSHGGVSPVVKVEKKPGGVVPARQTLPRNQEEGPTR